MTPARPAPVPASRATVPGLAWPGLPPPAGRQLLALQFQFEQSQWQSPKAIEQSQMRQLERLLDHAVAQCPHYREHCRHLAPPPLTLTADRFRGWPILRKRDVAGLTPVLRASAMPAGHGRLHSSATSGSTGMPLQVALSDVNALIQSALVLRSQIWHTLDFDAGFAAIKPGMEQGAHKDWGPVSAGPWPTGPSFTCDVRTDVALQLDWLCRVDPGYLLSYGANLSALLDRSHVTGQRPASLRKVLLFGDSAPRVLRARMRDMWGVDTIDAYSCGEFGPLAFQCPDTPEHLHVQSESVYLEVLRDDGTPCPEGEAGRVVVTDLHNFAMPMIRYELGDIAVPGPACKCGRGLPVLERVLGRFRNMAVDPQGRRFYPAIRTERILACAPIRQLQMVQLRPDLVEFRYVMERALYPEEHAALRTQLQDAFLYPFDLKVTRVESLPRGSNGKFEEFISLVDAT